MRELQEYISVGAKRMRCGYTTGSCAAAAARAAAELLVNGRLAPAVELQTPAGVTAIIDVEEHEEGPGWAQCAVRKDAGDDPDVTDGVLVRVRVQRCDRPGVHVEGGEGVGRVTRAGLDQPVGAAAINSVPRAMIRQQVELALASNCEKSAAGDDEADNALNSSLKGKPEGKCEDRGLLVTVSIPEGTQLAARTFNPQLGIEGGISVLGTSGIVRPMSEGALVATIELHLRVLRERGARDVLVVPGNYGRDFARDGMQLNVDDAVTCSNYFGATLDAASRLGFARMLVVGHLGKMCKVAGGVMNTHSRMADCRAEVLAAHAALAGAPQRTVAEIMQAATTDAALDAIDDCGCLNACMASLAKRLREKLNARAANDLQVEAVVFTKTRGFLCATQDAETLAHTWLRHPESPTTGREEKADAEEVAGARGKGARDESVPGSIQLATSPQAGSRQALSFAAEPSLLSPKAISRDGAEPRPAPSSNLILVIGGLASGKRAYAESLGFAPEDMACGVIDERPVVLDLHEAIAHDERSPRQIAEALANKQLVTCCEVGSGIVPASADERAWREKVGLTCARLAEHASSVVRMTCGIPVKLK